MTRSLSVIAVLIGSSLIAGSSAFGQPEDAVKKELGRLEGVWAEQPPKKGEWRVNALVFKEGKVVWHSRRYIDGELLIGHSIVYEVSLNRAATPKEINLQGKNGQERVGIYEIKDKALSIVFAGKDNVRPRDFEDKKKVLVLDKIVLDGQK